MPTSPRLSIAKDTFPMEPVPMLARRQRLHPASAKPAPRL
jgi:hypothetical protein